MGQLVVEFLPLILLPVTVLMTWIVQKRGVVMKWPLMTTIIFEICLTILVQVSWVYAFRQGLIALPLSPK